MPGAVQNFGLGILFQARDMASGPIGLLTNNFQGLLTSIKGGAPAIIAGLVAITAALAAFTVGLQGLRTAWDLAVEAGTFRRNMTAVAGISRATAQEMQLLEQSAINAGIATQFSPAQAAEGLQSLAAAGQNARDATATLLPVLDLAAGSLGQLGVAGAADAVVGTLNSYSMSATEAANVTDRLLRITQLTNFQARDFEQGLSRAAATAAQFGTNLDDVLISVGLMRNANIDASVASTAFREAQRRLMTDSGALSALQRLQVNAYDETTNASRSALDVMMDVAERTRDLTDAERNRTVTQIFGARGILAFNAVMQAQRTIGEGANETILRGRDAIEALRVELADAAGTAADFRDEYLSTFPGQLDLIRGSLETLRITIGDVFGVVLRPLVVALTDTINVFIRAWTSIPRGAQVAIAAIFLLTMAFLVVTGAAVAFGVAIAAVIAILGQLLIIVAAVAAGVLIALAPVFAAMIAFAGLAYLAYRAYQDNLGGLGDYINGWVSRVKLLWQGLTQLFTQGFLSGSVREELQRTENRGLLEFLGKLADFGARAQAVWDGVTKAFRRTWQNLQPTFLILVETLEVLFQELGRTFGDGPGGMMATFNNLPVDQARSFGEQIGDFLSQAIVFGARALILLVEGVIKLIDVYNALKPLIDAVTSSFNSFTETVNTGQQALANWASFVRENRSFFEAVGATGVISLAEGFGPESPMGQRRAAVRREAVGGIVTGRLAEARAELVTAEARSASLERVGSRISGGTERPAVVEARARATSAEAEVQRLSEVLGRISTAPTGARRTIAEIRADLSFGDERLDTALIRIAERRGNLEGQVIQEGQ